MRTQLDKEIVGYLCATIIAVCLIVKNGDFATAIGIALITGMTGIVSFQIGQKKASKQLKPKV